MKCGDEDFMNEMENLSKEYEESKCNTVITEVSDEREDKPFNKEEVIKSYKDAWDIVLEGLPPWKRKVVLDTVAGKEDINGRIYTEFVKSVVELAEN